MTARPAATPPRTARTFALSATVWAIALSVTTWGWAAPADAADGGSSTTSSTAATGGAAGGSATSGTGGTSGTSSTSGTSTTSASVSDLQAQAEELAAQIAADGRALDELDASYDAAEIRYNQLAAQQSQLKQSIAATSQQVATARKALKEQALLAYLAGGAPLITYLPDQPGMDPSLTVSYAEILAGGQKNAVETYRATLADQSQAQAALSANAQQATVALSDIRADRSQAAAALASEQQTMSQVQGQLAVQVAQVQAANQQAEETAVRASLSAEGQLPSTGPASTAPPSDPTTTPPAAPDTSPTTAHSRAHPAPAVTSPTTRPAPTAPKPPAPTPSPPATTTPATAPPVTDPPAPASNQPAPGASTAIAYAEAQLGKPYAWGGAGPNSFDCSGLVMMAWAQAGVYFPHLAQDQYDMTERIPLSDLLPGDLVFYGTPTDVYHVGIYIGGGNMIDAPETGQNVSIQNIYWSNLLGAGRVTG